MTYRFNKRRLFFAFLQLSFRQFVPVADKYPTKFTVVISEPWLICRCPVWQFGLFVRSKSSFAAIENVPGAYLLNDYKMLLRYRLGKQVA